jgi:hypothetical protein
MYSDNFFRALFADRDFEDWASNATIRSVTGRITRNFEVTYIIALVGSIRRPRTATCVCWVGVLTAEGFFAVDAFDPNWNAMVLQYRVTEPPVD